jgi:hypothetical protein
MFTVGYVNLEWLVQCGWDDPNCQLGWLQWNRAMASGEWP